jgi:tyrosinase
VPSPVRIRQNIKSLAVTDPKKIVAFFSRAIEKMQALPIKNPLSWRYQAAIHDYPFPDVDALDPRDKTKSFNLRRVDPADLANTFDRDPLARREDNLPDDRGTFWRQCQHGSWFFLPWHRMYLHHFEKIVMDQVAALGGPKDWALPYWDWTASDGDQRIPTQCRPPNFPDGTKNFLSIPQRNSLPGVPPRPPQIANNGDRLGGADSMDKGFLCLIPSDFTHHAGFGGGASLPQHGGEGPPDAKIPSDLAGDGVLEGKPHGSMHVATGGIARDGTAWMSLFTQAALDPIFWMHHCNVDRLWEIWIQRKSANRNPDDRNDKNDAKWLDQSFKFHDRTKGNGDLQVKQVLNTRNPPLSYEYDDTTDPLKGA